MPTWLQGQHRQKPVKQANEQPTVNSDPWTIYWQENRLDSCVPTYSEKDSRHIADFWQMFADNLAEDASVLDLATGNGTVPVALLNAVPTLRISAVDKADIAPPRFVRNQPLLGAVNFFPGVDLLALPFESGEFDAITSQFGIEYAPLEQACRQLRVLRKNGTLAFLMHHSDSEVLQPVPAKLGEIARLTASDGLLSAVERCLDGESSPKQLEQIGEAYLAENANNSALVSGQIFSAVGQVLEVARQDLRRARDVLANMTIRLGAESRRLQQLQRAALDADGMSRFTRMLEGYGIDVALAAPLYIEEDDQEPMLIAWQLLGRKI